LSMITPDCADSFAVRGVDWSTLDATGLAKNLRE
jgi:hypothetical protein